jgi:hypothetical protein
MMMRVRDQDDEDEISITRHDKIFSCDEIRIWQLEIIKILVFGQ